MPDAASYCGIETRTIQLSAAAIARGVRVVRNSSGLFTAAGATAALRGEFVTMQAGAASEFIAAAAMQSGGKVPMLCAASMTNGTTAIGEIAYAAANGLVSNVSTSAAVVGKFTTVTPDSTLGEVELLAPVAGVA